MPQMLTELVPISENKQAAADVIFVHGLNGDPIETWRLDASESWKKWITDSQSVNLWSLRYHLTSSGWRGGSMPIQDRAVNVLATIDEILIEDRPIIFLCHSYGGLLVKYMLRSATDIWPSFSELANRTRAIAFYGTPHYGSRIAAVAQSLAPLLRPSSAISELAYDSALLRELNSWFINRTSKQGWQIASFFENKKTNGVKIVDASSANIGIENIPPISIDADHIELPKPHFIDIRVKTAIRLIREAIESYDSKSHKEKEIYSNNDLESLRFYRKCFDRPAFRDKFADEVHKEDFEGAIEDTITALRTGQLRDRRDRQPLATGISVSDLQNCDIANTLDRILRALEFLLKIYRSSVAQNIAGGYGLRIFEYNGSYFKPDRDFTVEAAIDAGRRLIIRNLNTLLNRYGIRALSSPLDN